MVLVRVIRHPQVETFWPNRSEERKEELTQG